MKKYQAIFILNLKVITDEGEQIIKDIREKLEKSFNSKDVSIDNLGKKNLARPINKITNGLFIRFVFSTDPSHIKKFKEIYRLNKSVLRLVVYIYDIPKNKKVLQL